MKRRLLLTLLAVCLVASLCACSKSTVVTGNVEKKGETGGKYTNEFFKVGCASDEWTFMDQQESHANLQQNKEYFNEKCAELIDNGQSITDMTIVSPDQMSNINVTIGKGTKGSESISDAEILLGAYNEVKDQLDEAGFHINDYAIGELNFAGSAHSCMNIEISMLGINCYESIVLLREGAYYAFITSFSLSVEDAVANLGMFYAVK